MNLEKLRSYMQSFNDVSHDFAHVCRVVRLARELSLHHPKEHDITLVCRLAYLHDILDSKLVGEPLEGADGKELERILLKTIVPGLKDPELDRLLALIHRVGYRKRMAEEADEKDVDVPVELQIVRDADALDAIGAIGVFRVSAYGGKHAMDIGNVVKHWEDKLQHLGPSYYYTARAKDIAADRHSCMASYIGDLQRELESFGSPWEEEEEETGPGQDPAEQRLG